MGYRFVLVILLLWGVIPNQAMAQSKQQLKNDTTFKQVKEFLNNKQADSIYSLMGDKFRHQLSDKEFKGLCELQLFPLGPIKNSSLMSFVNNKLSTYEIDFEAVKFELLLTLDAAGKIELFVFQPYKIPKPDKVSVLSSNVLTNVMDKKVDSAAKKYILKGNTVGLSISVLRNDVIKSYNYGDTKRAVGILPNPDNIFEIGSVTKTFTATLLAWYVNAGKLRLNDPITKFLPDSVTANPALKHITLVMLSNHTSGLERLPDNMNTRSMDPLNPYKAYSKEQLFSYLKSCKLTGTPGEQYAYSNLAVGLLGTILQQVSGKSYEQMVQEIICEPLGMVYTVQHVDPLLAPHLVTEYNEDGEQTPMWDFGTLAALGALRSTTHDLMLYARANMYLGEDRLSRAFMLAHQITFTKNVSIALGWHIIKVNGVDYYFHDGGTYGSSSFVAWNADKKLAVVILSNSGESVNAVGVEILQKLQ